MHGLRPRKKTVSQKVELANGEMEHLSYEIDLLLLIDQHLETTTF